MIGLPSINDIRDTLSDINGALVDSPWTSAVDLGDVPSIPIHEPGRDKFTPCAEKDLTDPHTPKDVADQNTEEEPSIIFEIPPELDDRAVAEALSQHRGRDFETLVQLNGVDALGWYVPFHYRVAQHGIYISSAGALWLARQCFNHRYSDNPSECISQQLQFATHAILRHEAFHFAAECMAANWELVVGGPCYIKAFSQLKSSTGYIEHEEALANAYMYRGFRWASSASRGSKATQALKLFMQNQPPGYSDGINFVTADQYAEGCRDLAAMYHTCMGRKWFAPRDTFESLGLYPNVNQIDWRRCPIILVDEMGLFTKLGIVPLFIGFVLSIQETDLFKKQLARLGFRYEKLWNATRSKLSRTTRLPGLDFKPWPPRGKGWFSVRIDDDVRAHLRNDPDAQQWFAEEIGRHPAMGH